MTVVPPPVVAADRATRCGAAAHRAAPLRRLRAAPATPAQAPPARITLSPPSEMRVGSGPYTVPISVAGATRLSTLTLSITYNPALVRVRNVQEGTFMRQGGITPAFSSQIDDKSGRIDIVMTRPGDQDGRLDVGIARRNPAGTADRRHRLAGVDRIGNGARRRQRGAAVPAGGDHGAIVPRTRRRRSTRRTMQRGFTFVELLVVTTIVLILASAIQPLAKVTIQRTREAELRRVLREMRTAIDKFKDAADAGMIPTTELKANSEGYPPDLETLVDGVSVANDATGTEAEVPAAHSGGSDDR